MTRNGDMPKYVHRMQQELFDCLFKARCQEELIRVEPKAQEIYWKDKDGLANVNVRELARDAKALQKAARIAPEVRQEAHRLQEEADKALAEAQALKPQARLEDLHVWQMEKAKETKKGSRTYTYWMATWREGDKTRNVHLGSCRKMDEETARQKAHKLKALAIKSE